MRTRAIQAPTECSWCLGKSWDPPAGKVGVGFTRCLVALFQVHLIAEGDGQGRAYSDVHCKGSFWVGAEEAVGKAGSKESLESSLWLSRLEMGVPQLEEELRR